MSTTQTRRYASPGARLVEGFVRHQVPISIISHDPKVLKAIEGWGWNPGLRPRKDAPVWPMSGFRNRFFRAFDSNSAGR